jgi:hypothetical protein
MNTVVLIINEFGELELSVFVSVLIHFKSVGLKQDFVVFAFIVIVGLVNLVAIKYSLRQDGKLAVVLGVKLDLQILLWSARKFNFIHHHLLILLCVIDGDSKVRHAAHHDEVLAIS